MAVMSRLIGNATRMAAVSDRPALVTWGELGLVVAVAAHASVEPTVAEGCAMAIAMAVGFVIVGSRFKSLTGWVLEAAVDF